MREVNVFKWTQERQNDGRMRNIQAPDGVAIFHQFGCSYEEFDNGAGNYTTAIIERQDGRIQAVEASLIQFIVPTPTAASKSQALTDYLSGPIATGAA